jgi:hypothetical protein
MLKNLISAAVLAAAALALTVPALAESKATHPSARQALPVLVRAKPDPQVEQGHDPYVAFSLVRTTTGLKYRITQQEGPAPQYGTCLSSLTTEWTRALRGGVAFDLEPVPDGKYLNAGIEPCHGKYVLKVEWRASSRSYPTIRRFSFSYPSFSIHYLPTRPF